MGVASGAERFPVVLLTPGGGTGRTLNTAWAEELASHGYVVAALDHPYDSTAVVFADGRTVRRPAYPVGSDAEARRLVEELAAVKAADLSSALTYLGRLDSGEVESILAGRLDTDRAAVAGMSAGGGGAFQAARTDERFSAVVTLDGNPYDANPGPYDQPALALTNQSSTGSDDRDTFRPMTSVEGTDGVELYEFPAPRDVPQLGWLGPVALSVRTDRRCLGVSTASTDRCS
jgi:predicted dienelactone hydrolase